MVIIRPFKVLVCLSVIWTLGIVFSSLGYLGRSLSFAAGIQGEALSADPSAKPAQQLKSGQSSSGSQFPKSYSTGSQSSGSYGYRTSGSSRSYSGGSSSGYYDPIPAPIATQAAAVCPPQGCPPGPSGDQLFPPLGMFSQGGFGFGPMGCSVFLPRQGCRQFQVNAKLWYAKLNANTEVWGTNLIGGTRHRTGP